MYLIKQFSRQLNPPHYYRHRYAGVGRAHTTNIAEAEETFGHNGVKTKRTRTDADGRRDHEWHHLLTEYNLTAISYGTSFESQRFSKHVIAL
jgi:hypothetical protein